MCHPRDIGPDLVVAVEVCRRELQLVRGRVGDLEDSRRGDVSSPGV